MIQNIKDRVPVNVLSNNAIRYGIYDEDGKLLRYEYIKREDEPAEEGTPINRALFSNLQGDLYTSDRYNKPVVEYGELDEPTLVERDIMPKTWVKVTDTEYHAEDGTILTVSSVYGSRTPDRMFDVDVDTQWEPSASTQGWTQIEFPTAKKITKMAICMRASSAVLSTAKILGSNNGETWEELYEFTSWQQAQVIEIITLQNADFYKFYKIETTITSSSRYGIYEWQTYEYYESDGYIYNLDLPLSSYEKGKIVNIEGSSYFETGWHHNNIFKQNWTKVSDIKYSSSDGYVLEANGTPTPNLTVLCDEDTTTIWNPLKQENNWVKMTCPKPTKITKMKTYFGGTYFLSATIKGSKDNSEWVPLYMISSSQSTLEEITLENPDYYQYYQIDIVHSDGSYTVNMRDWQVSEWYGDRLMAEIFENPYININNLGTKLINGTIDSGARYSLIYNGESWNIISDKVVYGSFTAYANEFDIILGFEPDIVIAYDKSNLGINVAGNSTVNANPSQIPKIITKAYLGGVGKIKYNGFSYYGVDNTIYYIAIKFGR